MRHLLLLTILLLTLPVKGQGFVCDARDPGIFEKKRALLEKVKGVPFQERVVRIGKSFAGIPYIGGTLEGQPTETLVINLREMDCTTFVENSLALARVSAGEDLRFKAYQDSLRVIRYRGGIIDGYPSRLHYFTDWIHDKEAMGIVKNITASLGGIPLNKEINFMSTHRDLYAGLEGADAFTAIQEREAGLNAIPFYYIPSAKVSSIENALQTGDIVALVTTVAGLDVSHTGLLTREKNGRIHLLHASTSQDQVVVSPKPFTEYLAGRETILGIVVARPLAPVAP